MPFDELVWCVQFVVEEWNEIIREHGADTELDYNNAGLPGGIIEVDGVFIVFHRQFAPIRLSAAITIIQGFVDASQGMGYTENARITVNEPNGNFRRIIARIDLDGHDVGSPSPANITTL